MSATSTTDPAAGSQPDPRRLLVEELERRIEELEALDQAAIGQFTRWDWLLCVFGAVVIPGVALWWFAG